MRAPGLCHGLWWHQGAAAGLSAGFLQCPAALAAATPLDWESRCQPWGSSQSSDLHIANIVTILVLAQKQGLTVTLMATCEANSTLYLPIIAQASSSTQLQKPIRSYKCFRAAACHSIQGCCCGPMRGIEQQEQLLCGP